MLKETLNRSPQWAKDPILVGYRGSDAHGTKLANNSGLDDIDTFSIVIHPKRYYLGLDGYRKKLDVAVTDGEKLDIVVYEFMKWLSLSANGNPNCLSWLWNREEDYQLITPIGQILLDNRNIFLSKQMFKRLSGYAMGQLKRMEASTRGEVKYEGYMGKKRKLLVDKHGYDCKNAAHVIRLLMLSQELAVDGTLYSYRPLRERELIKQVKGGEFSLKEIKAIIIMEFERAKVLEAESNLPDNVDENKINGLSELCLTTYFNTK